MTSNVSLNQALQASQQTTNSSNQLAQDFDDFLVLLTTQLQHQDPLSPMDSTEFTNQLVQFSQVEQQINQNAKLDSLIALNTANLTGAVLSYIGKDVMVQDQNTYYDGENAINIDYQMETQAVESTIRIEDSDGQTVREILIQPELGVHRIQWDGKDDNGAEVAEGRYKVFIDALDTDGNAVSTTIATSARVEGVDSQGGDLQLILRGGDALPIGSVLSVTEPEQLEANNSENNEGSSS